MAYRNIRYRLYPKTRAKADKLNRCLGATRYVWNHFLAENRAMMEAHRLDSSNPRPPISFFSLGREFTALRRQTDWLLELPANPIKYTLKYQADAWRQCFVSGKGFPRFKAKHRYDDSVTFTKKQFSIKGKYLYLCRIGQVALRGTNPYPDAEPVQVVVTKESDRFFATVCYDVGEVELNDNGRSVGIDMNVGQFATSDGEIRRAPDCRKQEAKGNRYKRMMARRQGPDRKKGIKASNRYLAVRAKAKKASAKIKNTRANWQHQESRRIADRNQYAVVENLNTKGMTKSAKGTAENPGTHVRAKSGLNRAILNTGWSGLRRKLSYKCEVIEMDARNTSRMCRRCGHIDKANRRTQSKFECVSCGHRDNADVNAALNIQALGTRAIGRGRGVCIENNLDDLSRRYAPT